MILSHLILAHLLGDFVLQPSKLVKWKMSSKWGVLIHVLIHLIINLLIFLPLILLGHYIFLPVIFMVIVVHFLIDQSKISFDLKTDRHTMPFVIDQIMHLSVIFFAYLILKQPLSLPDTLFYGLYSNIKVILFLIFLILGTQVLDIYKFQKARETNKNATYSINKKEFIRKIIILSMLYLLFSLISYSAYSGHVSLFG